MDPVRQLEIRAKIATVRDFYDLAFRQYEAGNYDGAGLTFQAIADELHDLIQEISQESQLEDEDPRH